MQISRRSFLAVGSAGALGALVAPRESSAADRFSFVHFTDVHIQPELRAADGTRRCIAKINALKPEFAICGGDLVYDACAVEYPRAKQVFDLYAESVKPLNMAVYRGLALRPARLDQKRYRGQGVHRLRGGGSDRLAEDGPRADEARLDAVVTHVPLVSSVLQLVPDPWKTADIYLVTNAQDVLNVLWPYKPRLVLQGHTHIRETVTYNGCQFITSGAVCGNWWKGPRDGHPEGFGVLTVRGDEVRWRYETYGFVVDKT